MSQWNTIRRKAAELIKDYEKKAHEEQLPTPFSAVSGSHAVLPQIARHCLQLSVFVDRTLSEGILGCISTEEDTISISPLLNHTKKNFVIAHEIGHAVLQHPPRPFINDLTRTEIPQPFYSWDRGEDINEEPNAATLLPSDGGLRRYSTRANVELQANVFAAELLAPLDKVREWVQNRGRCDIEEMTAYFGLSKNALKNQLMAAFCGAVLVEDDTERSLPDLDPEQHKAAAAEGPALVVAGPGAGKTRVLTARVVHLLAQKEIQAQNILVLTYSNKAAEEMRSRISMALPEQSHEFSIGTYHALGQQLLLDYWREAGFSKEPVLLTDADAFVLLRSHIGHLSINSFGDIVEPSRNLDKLLDAIARLKDELISPQDFRTHVERWKENSKRNLNKHVQKAEELATVYEYYQALLEQENYVDYGDLLIKSVRLFEDDNVEWAIKDRYRQVLVDEFQDVNLASGRLTQMLDGRRGVIWAVADPRQSIYAFRGAARTNLEEFATTFPGAQILPLSVNYRSVEDIVQAGNSIPFGNQKESHHFQPEINAHRPRSATPAITVATAPNLQSEIKGIVVTVEELLATGYSPQQIAVLCRRRAMAHHISIALEDADIPTDWCGAMHEQAAFKDMMAVLMLASNHPLGLPRLLCHPAHRVNEDDRQIILQTLNSKKGSARAALRAICKDEVPGVSPDGRECVEKLRGFAIRAARRPSAYNALSAYLWEETNWFFQKCQENSSAARRYVATVGQLVDLAREFSGKGAISSRAQIAAFVDYVRSCLEAGKLKTSHDSVAIPGAVSILTIHGSKGLEWPVVLVPGCLELSPPSPFVVWPPTLAANLASGNDEQSRACLSYVAVTRARERLILSRIDDECSVPEKNIAELVATIEKKNTDENLSIKCTVWPDIKAQQTEQEKYEIESVVTTTEECPKNDEDSSPAKEIDIEVLEALQFCGQKAKYIHVDGFRAESTGYMLFRRILNQTFEWMILEHNTTTVPSWNDIEAYLMQLWDAAEPDERQLGEYYQARSKEYVRLFLERLARSQQVRWKLPFTNERCLKEVTVKFNVDECENTTPPVFRWHSFTSIPPEKLRMSLRLALYSRRQIRGVVPKLHVYHVPTGVERVTSFRTEDWEIAKQEITRLYNLWQQQEFVPNHTHQCLPCVFNVICPS